MPEVDPARAGYRDVSGGNEPVVADERPMCWIDPQVIDEARGAVERQENPWGPLCRTSH
ncbi:DUF6098 family protein [Streptomyces pseudovenezuelae]|uniref:DUF6098 family protein n=1 Tax=Streptomyces pseudovenezuelae TaxID=67350 RepID=UPI003719B3B7